MANKMKKLFYFISAKEFQKPRICRFCMKFADSHYFITGRKYNYETNEILDDCEEVAISLCSDCKKGIFQ